MGGIFGYISQTNLRLIYLKTILIIMNYPQVKRLPNLDMMKARMKTFYSVSYTNLISKRHHS